MFLKKRKVYMVVGVIVEDSDARLAGIYPSISPCVYKSYADAANEINRIIKEERQKGIEHGNSVSMDFDENDILYVNCNGVLIKKYYIYKRTIK